MTDDDGDEGETPPPGEPSDSFEPASEADLDRLREEFAAFRADVETRTLHREAVEEDLRSYVRGELRSGHARNWGPYLVLLYGTVMTIAALYYETGLSAIVGMIIIWLSTLGLYVLMVLVGAGLHVAGIPVGLVSRLRNR